MRKEREAVIETTLKEKEVGGDFLNIELISHLYPQELVSQINNREEMLLKTQALVASQRDLIYRSSGGEEQKREGSGAQEVDVVDQEMRRGEEQGLEVSQVTPYHISETPEEEEGGGEGEMKRKR